LLLLYTTHLHTKIFYSEQNVKNISIEELCIKEIEEVQMPPLTHYCLGGADT